ncbi:hypothetical protein [Paenibacillus sp. NPDC057934]|uniref:hypothetical protein n=1 Tax=Paenibacillus sp. NPDC057934 TaxID=3346282 RepID=UPI0036D7DB50
MAKLNIQDPPASGSGREFYLLGYNRTGIDSFIIALSYVLMPIGLVAAILRMLLTHYKNQQKASNYNLLCHALIGGFVDLSLIMILSGGLDELNMGIFFIVFIAILFLMPAYFLGNAASKAKLKFSQLCHSYIVMSLDEGVRYIGTLAQFTGQSESDVRRDLRYLQEQGLIPNGLTFYEGQGAEGSAVKETTSTARAGQAAAPSGSTERTSASSEPKPKPGPQQLPKAMRCPGCGAQNTVQPGQAKPCDYCGTTLTYS